VKRTSGEFSRLSRILADGLTAKTTARKLAIFCVASEETLPVE
jgi:hypothetical protein